MTLSEIFYDCINFKSLEGDAVDRSWIDDDVLVILESNGVDVDGIFAEIAELE